MKVLVLDNYDSFTFNLVQYIEELLGQKVDVYRNDEISLDAVEAYDAVVLSPGPGIPSESGIMPALIRRYAPTKALLGVCLGHQAIGEAFGADLENLEEVYHGIETAMIRTEADDALYRSIPDQFQAGRYHSWVVKRDSIPECLQLTVEDEWGRAMGFRHREYRVWGVQYHPESIMTEHGKQILQNFFDFCVTQHRPNTAA